MKLRNRKTGEIVEVASCDRDYDGAEDIAFHKANAEIGSTIHIFSYDSLAELNAEWEDYEEPKEYWYIDDAGVIQIDQVLCSEINMRKSIGNYFETKEEAELAVRKLKAWKRLKDKGFRFDGWTIDDGLKISICTNFEGDNIYSESEKEIRTNLDLLLGGEE